MTEITDNTKRLPVAVERFVLHWGDLGGRWGVNRSVAQIHALLYVSERPLTAEEIADMLGLARSNVSNSIKELLGLEPDPARPDPGRPARSFRGRGRHLGDVHAHRGRPQGARARSGDRGAARLRGRGARAIRRCTPSPARGWRSMLGFVETMDRWYAQMLARAEAEARGADPARRADRRASCRADGRGSAAAKELAR